MNLQQPPPKRRNGLQAACEPCRKAKIRCDRAIPTCTRCVKRKTPSACVFLAAPVSKQYSGSDSVIPKSPEPYTGQGDGAAIKSASRRASTAGYLGSTSFSATLQQGHLTEEPDFIPDSSYSSSADNDYTDPKTQALGLKVLSGFPDKETSFRLLEWYSTSHCQVGFHKPSTRSSLQLFWSTFGSELCEPRKIPNLERIGSLINRNGKVLLERPDDAIEWVAAFSGPKTRWETLGILFVAFCYTCISVPENELDLLHGGSKVERKTLVEELTQCVEACIELSRHSLNNLTCTLLYRHMLLKSVLEGDTALSVWRLHSDVVATAVAHGLHCYTPPSKITLDSEITKRLSACIFWGDKEMAIFTGRPPSLSHRYYSCPLPLDISDDALSAGGEVLELAISKLDADGWNTDGGNHEATICRLFAIYSMHMDEIIEIFLGNKSQWCLERVYSIKQKLRNDFTKLPATLTRKKAISECKSDHVMWSLLTGRLDYLRINFLVERLLTERGGTGKGDLLELAREMLDLVVFIWLERDRSRYHQHDYDFMIMCYGMPSIGVLCVELLRQAREPEEQEPKLPRSEIVQNLSLMIGFLNWVKPTAGNYKLCRRMSQVIKRVLDQFFDTNVEKTQDKQDLLTPDFSTDDWPIEGLDDLEWLNSIDWTQGPYIDFNL